METNNQGGAKNLYLEERRGARLFQPNFEIPIIFLIL